MTTLPFGSWPSPIPASLLVEQAVGLSDLDLVGDDLVWSESRPGDGGRQVVVRHAADGTTTDLIPRPFSARSMVHEYGGRSYAVASAACFFVNFADQRVWAVTTGSEPVAITAESDPPRSVRYGDLILDEGRSLLYAVRERHGVDGRSGADGVENDLVRIDVGDGDVTVVASGHDFYSAPRLAPDGKRLAYLAWDHPSMPWQASQLFVVELDDRGDPGLASPVAGGPEESISQPRFDGDGELYYLSDRSGFLSLYRGDGTPLIEIGADLGGPEWVLGTSSYAFFDDAIVVAVETPTGSELTIVRDGSRARLDDRFDSASYVRASGATVVAICGSATEPVAVVRFTLDGPVEVIRSSRAMPIDPGDLSRPRPITFPSPDGPTYALYYPPTNSQYSGPIDVRPPLVVMSHGGPTSRTEATFNLRVQYLTTRGIAVVDVNYGGSTGFGRAYRDRLAGRWGVVDVRDCVGAARHLADEGLVDPGRLAIRGGSAGGYTTLCALAFSDTFAVGASLYGVSDLRALAEDTHKFESRYLDGLVGRLPEDLETYLERSPLEHAEQITCPVIFLQGLDDAVVPPAESEVLVSKLAARGVPVAYLTFPGEGHGFRGAEAIVAATESELVFFGRVLGFAPSGVGRDVTIENAGALAHQ